MFDPFIFKTVKICVYQLRWQQFDHATNIIIVSPPTTIPTCIVNNNHSHTITCDWYGTSMARILNTRCATIHHDQVSGLPLNHNAVSCYRLTTVHSRAQCRWWKPSATTWCWHSAKVYPAANCSQLYCRGDRIRCHTMWVPYLNFAFFLFFIAHHKYNMHVRLNYIQNEWMNIITQTKYVSSAGYPRCTIAFETARTRSQVCSQNMQKFRYKCDPFICNGHFRRCHQLHLEQIRIERSIARTTR